MPRTYPHMEYMHTDVPPGMTLEEYRRAMPRKRESAYVRAVRVLLANNPTMNATTAQRVVEEMN